ncbi:MAG: hypothetical protein NT005_02800 [Spirochaetes bacterium]|nr:hypothetical protein [Spirochaetota bacterium]
MNSKKTTFALFYGNRGFFPASIIAEARSELPRVLKEMGHESIFMDQGATRHGAIRHLQKARSSPSFSERIAEDSAE